jgi:hypothetical protein
MTFASSKVGRNIRGKYAEYIYTFTAASGDTTGNIQTPLKKIIDINVSGELADGSAILAGATARLSATPGQVVVAFTNPGANAKGRVVVTGYE